MAYSGRGLTGDGVGTEDLSGQLALTGEVGQREPVDVRSTFGRCDAANLSSNDKGLGIASSLSRAGEVPLGRESATSDGVGDEVVLAEDGARGWSAWERLLDFGSRIDDRLGGHEFGSLAPACVGDVLDGGEEWCTDKARSCRKNIVISVRNLYTSRRERTIE